MSKFKNLAVAQINTFSDAMEKTQRVESARLQVRSFQSKKRDLPSSNFGKEDKNIALKFGREIDGIRLSGTPRGALSREGQGERGQHRDARQESSASTSCIFYGYCGKPNCEDPNFTYF